MRLAESRPEHLGVQRIGNHRVDRAHRGAEPDLVAQPGKKQRAIRRRHALRQRRRGICGLRGKGNLFKLGADPGGLCRLRDRPGQRAVIDTGIRSFVKDQKCLALAHARAVFQKVSCPLKDVGGQLGHGWLSGAIG